MKKVTHEDFVLRVKEVRDDWHEYELLDRYINMKTPMKMKHICGRIAERLPLNFIRGKGCRECRIDEQANNKVISHQEFMKRAKEKRDNLDEYEILDEYKRSNIHIRVKHKCGHVYSITPNNFLKGRECSECVNRIRTEKQTYSHNDYIDLVKKERPDDWYEYEFLEEYKGARKYIKIRHTCGYILEKTTASKFLNQKVQCDLCRESNIISHDEFVEKVKIKRPNDWFEYTFLEEYSGAHDYLKMQHNCGYIMETTTADSFSNQMAGCSKCGIEKRAESRRKTNEEFLQKVYDLVGEEYTVLEEYKGSDEYIKIKHNKCGHILDKTTSSSFLAGRRCPKCRESKGESSIARYLDNRNIRYVREFKFDDCVYKDKLKFDFALLDENDQVKLLIEFDGEQHYNPFRFETTFIPFTKRVTRDIIKNEYCKKNEIQLLRIPYWDENNINQILDNFLESYNVSRV